MLRFAAGAPFDYVEPWNATLYERRRSLVARSRHIAYIYERPDSSTFRYRVFNMIEALDARPDMDVSAAWFTLDEAAQDLSFIDRADAVVICRTRYDSVVARIVARAHARAIPAIFDVDDLIFDTGYTHLITQTLDVNVRGHEDWDHWFAYIGRLGATMRGCDAAIGTNAFLAERMATFAPWLPVSVVPNFLNRQQTEASRVLVDRKRAMDYRRDGQVHVGYFSGTPTHNRDLLIASPGLAAAFERFPQLRLRIVGFIELNAHLRPYIDRIEIHPLQDFLNLQRLTAEVELSIVPLQDNDFTQCKSELKYFEAGVVGVPTVASPTCTFVRAITEGVTGFLSGSHEWGERIAAAVDLVDDQPDAYRAMAERVVADSEQRYAWNDQAGTIVAAVFG